MSANLRPRQNAITYVVSSNHKKEVQLRFSDGIQLVGINSFDGASLHLLHNSGKIILCVSL